MMDICPPGGATKAPTGSSPRPARGQPPSDLSLDAALLLDPEVAAVYSAADLSRLTDDPGAYLGSLRPGQFVKHYRRPSSID